MSENKAPEWVDVLSKEAKEFIDCYADMPITPVNFGYMLRSFEALSPEVQREFTIFQIILIRMGRR